MDNSWDFLVANEPLLYFKSLFIDSDMYLLFNSTTCHCTLKCTFTKVNVQILISVVIKSKQPLIYICINNAKSRIL
jgi:hypothetical protein